MANKKKFEEGDLFAVPLSPDRFALGLIARKTKVAPLGYFFDAIYPQPPKLADLNLEDLKTLTIAMFGTVGLTRGEWPIIGKLPDFKREAWPVPMFQKTNVAHGNRFAVEYSDSDFGTPIGYHDLPREALDRLPEDGLMGYLYLVDHLEGLLHSRRI